MGVRIRPEVAALPAYKAGRPPKPGPDGVGWKLSSNENPWPPLPGVLEAAERAATLMNRYPDPACTELTEATAAMLAVPPEQLAFGTGSVALLYQVLQAVCTDGDEVVTGWRSFEAYPIAIQLTGARQVKVPLTADAHHDLDAMAAAITDRTRAVLVCTPNNPTGPAVDHEALVAFCDRVPSDVLVVVDEAYVEFVRDERAARGLDLLDRDNILVLRTFSKAYGLAGFRIGYAVSNLEVTSAVRATSLPFGVSGVGQAAAVASLAARPLLLERVDELVAERERVVSAVRGAGLTVPDTQANFFWLPLRADTERLADLFADAGISVRPFPGEGLRISIGETRANDRVIEVCSDFCSNPGPA